MTKLHLFILCSLLVACSGSKKYEQKLRGNKFRFQAVTDTTAPQHDLVEGMLATVYIEMDFKADGKMLYKLREGEKSIAEQTLTWKVSGDSLITLRADGRKTGYRILKAEGDWIFMTIDSANVVLKQIP